MTNLEEDQHLGDISLSLEAELGRKPLTMRQILALEVGSVIRLTRPAGDVVALVMGGIPIASGEIVRGGETVRVCITDFEEEI